MAYGISHGDVCSFCLCAIFKVVFAFIGLEKNELSRVNAQNFLMKVLDKGTSYLEYNR